MNIYQKKTNGFTLIEMLLVLAIISSMLVLMLKYTTQKSDEMRRDKTVMQFQQILNAGLSYYVNTATWPVTVAATPCGTLASVITLNTTNPLVTAGYLPVSATALIAPYNQESYNLNCDTANMFYAYVSVDTPVDASIIAGRLPMGFVTNLAGVGTVPASQPSACASFPPATGCTFVVASVNVPGQNLNNARSVNFAGTYSSGGCVPAPNCPSGMSPSIMVVPAAVSGVYDPPTPASAGGCSGTNTSGCISQVSPVSSFTAFAVGGAAGVPIAPNPGPYDCSTVTPQKNKLPCLQTVTNPTYDSVNGGTGTQITVNGTLYWRVCLAVVTQKGSVAINTNGGNSMAAWGQMMGKVVAFTRCVPNDGVETPSGSPYNVWQSNVGFTP